MKLFYRITQTFFSLYFKLFYRHKVYGTELIPEGAALIASNHSSYFAPQLSPHLFPKKATI
ncbi:hypothetical protein PHSC3_001842 [Chlamydiales bacterium STE3]|nr:hypothetical protein PHSC3_001842 [Chlamydiales bacterium STE3]